MRAGELGLSQSEVVGNVITALTSNQMIAPSLWIDPRNGNHTSWRCSIPRSRSRTSPTCAPFRCAARHPRSRRAWTWSAASSASKAPPKWITTRSAARSTFSCGPLGEDLSAHREQIDALIASTKLPKGVEITLRGMVQSMRASFTSFGIGLLLSVLLLYLILVAQFRSFIDPFIILLALPPGITGVLLTLWLTGTTLNVMSLMGVVMLAGVAMSNSILIVEFAHHLIGEGAQSERRSSRPAACGCGPC